MAELIEWEDREKERWISLASASIAIAGAKNRDTRVMFLRLLLKDKQMPAASLKRQRTTVGSATDQQRKLGPGWPFSAGGTATSGYHR